MNCGPTHYTGCACHEANRDQRIGNLEKRLSDMTYDRNILIQAAQAVLERWDSPHWKDLPATAEFINSLRYAVERTIHV